MNAFVTDGDQRPALAITRSLGRRGIGVIVGEERPASLASSSRYCVRHVTYPSPYADPEGFRRFVLDFIAQQHVDVVVPVTDVTTSVVAHNQDAIRRHSALAVAPFDAFDRVTDKGSLMRLAAECGVPIPRTVFVENGRAIDRVLDGVAYPAVIKPVRSRTLTDQGWQLAMVHYAHSADDLRQLYESVEYLADHPSLIQERIAGPGVGVFVLCDHGRLLTAFAHRRLREKPPSGGASVLSESAAVDPELLDQAMRLLEPLRWHGVAMVEYKRDQRTGQAFLMEINGRFWGSLQLALDAGVDFPALSYDLALGRPPAVPAGYQAGIRNRWLLGDVDHLLLRLFNDGADIPASAPSRFRLVLDFLKLHGANLRYDVFARDDRRPARFEFVRYVKALLEAAAERRRRRVRRREVVAPVRSTVISPAQHQRQR